MQLCGKCGHYSSDESIFCGHCGNRVNNRCLDCGFQNLLSQKFCGSCGKQLQDDGTLPGSARRYGHDASLTPPKPPTLPPPQPTSISPTMAWESTPSTGTFAESPSEEALPEFALLSVEFAQWDQTLSMTSDLQGMEQQRQHYLLLLEQHFRTLGGDVTRSKNGVLFIAFRHEASVVASLGKAIEAMLPVLREPFLFGPFQLQLRGGLGLEHSQAHNPLTSTLERSSSQPGKLLINEAAFLPIQHHYPADFIGPVEMGGQTVNFYQLPATPVALQQAPSPAPVAQATAPPTPQSQDALQSLWEMDEAANISASLSQTTPTHQPWPEFPTPPGQPVATSTHVGEGVSPGASTQNQTMAPHPSTPSTTPAVSPIPAQEMPPRQSPSQAAAVTPPSLQPSAGQAPTTSVGQPVQTTTGFPTQPSAPSEGFPTSGIEQASPAIAPYPVTPATEPQASVSGAMPSIVSHQPDEAFWGQEAATLTEIYSPKKAPSPPAAPIESVFLGTTTPTEATASYTTTPGIVDSHEAELPSPLQAASQPFPEMVVPQPTEAAPVAGISPEVQPDLSPQATEIPWEKAPWEQPPAHSIPPQADTSMASFETGAPQGASAGFQSHLHAEMAAGSSETPIPPVTSAGHGDITHATVPDRPPVEEFHYGRGENQEDEGSPEGGRSLRAKKSSGPVAYEPPVLGIVGPQREFNIRYAMAMEAMTTEMEAFFAQDTAAKGRVLALCADDGLGKSNIIGMARMKADPESERGIWIGGSNSRVFHRNGLPLFFWLELVQNLLGLVFEGQPQAEVRDIVAQFLNHVYEDRPHGDEQAFLIDFLCGDKPSPLSADMRDRLDSVQRFFATLISKLAERRPVVLVVEDWMYADAASLEILAALLRESIPSRPVYLILSQTRDFYPQGELAAALQGLPYKELVIANLDEEETARFLDDGPLGGNLRAFPALMIDLIDRHAHGNPLYLEESLRLLHLRDFITVDPNSHKFVLKKEFAPEEVVFPETVSALILERLEHLDDGTLYTLRLAAVLGEKFAVNLLIALGQMSENDFNEKMNTLFNHGYLVPDAPNTGRFRHGAIWETVYDTIPEEFRIQMHQLLSAALENDFNQGLSVNPMLIAHHAQYGHLPNRALNYWNLAGIYAGQIGSLTAMNVAMFRALDLMATSSDIPLQNQELALRTLENLGIFNLDRQPELTRSMLSWVVQQREAHGQITQLLEPLSYLAVACEKIGTYTEALTTLDKALTLLNPHEFPLEMASLQISRMEYLYTLGSLQKALDVMNEQIEPVADQQGYEQGPADFFDAYLQARLLKAQVMLAQCNPETATLLEATLRYAQERQMSGLSIALQLTLAHTHLRQGLYEACNKEADNLLSAIEAMPDGDWFLAQWGLLAISYHGELEDWNSAGQLVLTVISKSQEVKDYHSWIVAQIYAGYIAGQSGKIREGRQLLEQAIGLSSEYRFAAAAILGWRLLAEFEFSLGNIDVAYEIATQALHVANKPDIRHTYEIVQLTLLSAKALLAKGDIKAAGRLLEPLWPQTVQARWNPLIAKCAFEIGELYKALSTTSPPDLTRKHLVRSVEFYLKAKSIWLELGNRNQVQKVDAALPQI